ncbi:response regulator [Oceanibacterium hippocampi]|uniref:Response regulator MprA n=1 Tax=Oceanibacterium hippocampi TaxID=745714 RepID=A0A1Y5S003_9PROT|nr:response regulator [Oceanibacterium hippocampi]SLN26529.1 Response regulator MprA [Oceanibacterium hippocampi]
MARILVADDEETVREFVTRALRYRGHEVGQAIDGASALEALQREPFDLLLTDIVMPVMDGIALALKVSRDYPAMRILMMTGYANERQRAHNLDALIHDVILKPFSLDEICAKVDEALAVPHA